MTSKKQRSDLKIIFSSSGQLFSAHGHSPKQCHAGRPHCPFPSATTNFYKLRKMYLVMKAEKLMFQLHLLSFYGYNCIDQCFPNFFVCWHIKKAKHISRHYSCMNLFILIASSITGDSEKGDDLFFLEVNTFPSSITQSTTLSAITS